MHELGILPVHSRHGSGIQLLVGTRIHPLVPEQGQVFGDNVLLRHHIDRGYRVQRLRRRQIPRYPRQRQNRRTPFVLELHIPRITHHPDQSELGRFEDLVPCLRRMQEHRVRRVHPRDGRRVQLRHDIPIHPLVDKLGEVQEGDDLRRYQLHRKLHVPRLRLP